MDILYLSVTLEGCTVLAAIIFSSLLLVTRHLPKFILRTALALLANVAFIALFYLLINVGWVTAALALLWLFVPAALSLGIFFYYFSTSYFVEKYTRSDKILIWVMSVICLMCVGTELINLFVEESPGFDAFRIFLTESSLRYVFPLFNIVVIVKGFLLVSKVEKRNKNEYSSDIANNLKWAKISLGIYSFFIVGMILSELVYSEVSEVIFNVSLLMLVLYVGYYEIRKISTYIRHISVTKSTQEQETEEETEVREEKTEKDQERFKVLFEEVEEYISLENKFLDMDISVTSIAKGLDVNSKYVSHSINSNAGMNFNSFINRKRVEFAKEMMLGGHFENYSIEGIAGESGFRSKSTFNNAFKKYIGKTPSEFQKSI